MKNRLGIIVINFNRNQDTLFCLQSIEKFCGGSDTIVYLIDNASDDPIKKYELYPFNIKINYLIQSTNYGFAKGNNIGIIQAIKDECNYLMLLNNDTEFVDNSLFNCIQEMENNKRIAICGLVNYFYDKPNMIWQAGAFIDLKNGEICQLQNINTKTSDPFFVDYVPGSSFIIKSSIIKEIGMLDEDYFAYYEESDFCLRVKRMGLLIAFIPNSKILHKVGKSTTNAKRFYLRTRNKLLFYSKYSKKSDYIFIYLKIIKKCFRTILSKKTLNRFEHFKCFLFSLIDFHLNNYGKGHF